jgi:hypothetical protein
MTINSFGSHWYILEDDIRMDHREMGMAHSWVADGGDSPQMWRLAVNILNKHTRAAKGWSSNLVVR